MVGPWAYGRLEGRHVDCWLSSRAGWSADVLCGGTIVLIKILIKRLEKTLMQA